MKTKIILISMIFSSVFASAATIPVKNISNLCSCTVKIGTQSLKCRIQPTYSAIEFGTESDDQFSSKFTLLAGQSNNAPITNNPDIGPSIYFIPAGEINATDIGLSLDGLANAKSLVVVLVETKLGPIHGGSVVPLNSAWINSSTCQVNAKHDAFRAIFNNSIFGKQ